ncbi:MAG: hypothetical protein HYU27_10055 [Acidobacteria bacterium]|nr:hypothetical protein [Acidobacteriota bacterium]
MFTSNLVSTLTPSVVNEFRFGLRRNVSGNTHPCDIPEVRDELYAYLPKVNGYPLIPQPTSFADNKLQGTYVWSKSISGCGNSTCTAWVNVLDRSLDRSLQDSHRAHDFRINGAWELPFGPDRMVLGGSSGVLARLVERWQLSWILNMTSGAPLSLSSTNTYIGSGRPRIVGPFPKDQGKATMTAALPVYFAPGAYRLTTDPQCANVTTLQATRTACTLGAIEDSQGRIVLQHAVPGTLGNLGENWIEGPGSFRFDMRASKTGRIGENKSVQVRMDARNILNHPILGNPNLNINNANFGQIPADAVTGARQFRAQLRFTF